jgi:hypothetical protein
MALHKKDHSRPEETNVTLVFQPQLTLIFQQDIILFSLSGGSNSVVECDLAKVEVAGSNPVSRSISLLYLPSLKARVNALK